MNEVTRTTGAHSHMPAFYLSVFIRLIWMVYIKSPRSNTNDVQFNILAMKIETVGKSRNLYEYTAM